MPPTVYALTKVDPFSVKLPPPSAVICHGPFASRHPWTPETTTRSPVVYEPGPNGPVTVTSIRPPLFTTEATFCAPRLVLLFPAWTMPEPFSAHPTAAHIPAPPMRICEDG